MDLSSMAASACASERTDKLPGTTGKEVGGAASLRAFAEAIAFGSRRS